jgi:hypothetical protein
VARHQVPDHRRHRGGMTALCFGLLVYAGRQYGLELL